MRKRLNRMEIADLNGEKEEDQNMTQSRKSKVIESSAGENGSL